MERWVQLEFNFADFLPRQSAGEKPRKKKAPRILDYERIARAISDREISTDELRRIAGLKRGENVGGIIDTLSLTYTLYSERKGYYKMLRPVK